MEMVCAMDIASQWSLSPRIDIRPWCREIEDLYRPLYANMHTIFPRDRRAGETVLGV